MKGIFLKSAISAAVGTALLATAVNSYAAPSIVVLNSNQETCAFKMQGNGLQVNGGGGVQVNNNSSLSGLETDSCLTNHTTFMSSAGNGISGIVANTKVLDPLARLVPPPAGPAKKVSGCTDNKNTYLITASNAASCSNIPAGYYPGGLVIDDSNANVVLGAGTYTLGGQGLIIRHGSVDGSAGVMFYIQPPSSSNGNPMVDIQSERTIKLNGSTSGAYTGVVLYQDKGNSNPIKISDGSTGTVTLRGIVYAPSATLNFNISNNLMYGLTSGTFPGIVADKIYLSGAGRMNPQPVMDPVAIDNYLNSQFKNFPAELGKHQIANCYLAITPMLDVCSCYTQFVSSKTKDDTRYILSMQQYNQGSTEAAVRLSMTADDIKTNDSVFSQLFGTRPLSLGTLKAWCTKNRVVSIP